MRTSLLVGVIVVLSNLVVLDSCVLDATSCVFTNSGAGAIADIDLNGYVVASRTEQVAPGQTITLDSTTHSIGETLSFAFSIGDLRYSGATRYVQDYPSIRLEILSDLTFRVADGNGASIEEARPLNQVAVTGK